MSWPPSITVASVIYRDGRYLLVKEVDKATGIEVFNQPAGHLEPGETLVEAAIREAFEESCWKISIEALLGVSLFKNPTGQVYLRHTFSAIPIEQEKQAKLDSDIISTHWLSIEEIENHVECLRSPIVLEALKWHRSGITYPLELLR